MKKCFMIKCYIPYSEKLYTFQNIKYYIKIDRERNGSVIECLTLDRGAAGSSLTGVTVLCP